jgi:hypothetical protein
MRGQNRKSKGHGPFYGLTNFAAKQCNSALSTNFEAGNTSDHTTCEIPALRRVTGIRDEGA